jgi:hypothetical protein
MMAQILNGNPSPFRRQDAERITTPAGSTIEPTSDGRYQVCDARSHCRRADNLWEAQQLVQWAEVHHRPVDSDLP